jgi:hypothetical protein
MVVAALNCVLSGRASDCAGLLDPVLDGVDWETCNTACSEGWNADTALVLGQCLKQLDCWNNGDQWEDLDGDGPDTKMGCFVGPTHGCHDRGLCESPIAAYFTGLSCPEENLGPTSSVDECKQATSSACSISRPGACEDNGCIRE